MPAEAASRALEVVSDLVLAPLLRPRDLIGEKPVIVDEIRMYVDSPETTSSASSTSCSSSAIRSGANRRHAPQRPASAP